MTGMNPPSRAAMSRRTPTNLTHAREMVALTVCATGFTYEYASRRLGISARTLRRYLASAMARLDAANSTHAVALAAADDQLDAECLRTRTVPAWPMQAPARAPEEAARSADNRPAWTCPSCLTGGHVPTTGGPG